MLRENISLQRISVLSTAGFLLHLNRNCHDKSHFAVAELVLRVRNGEFLFNLQMQEVYVKMADLLKLLSTRKQLSLSLHKPTRSGK